MQACVVNALEPEWEARFEPRSYGFRPGRGCNDAIEAIYWTLNGKHARRQWILDADLSAAFDRIDHDHLLAALGTFPARELVRQWLKARVVERGRFAPTEEGTPQGGMASPLLLNVAMYGMEAAAGVQYFTMGVEGARTVAGTPALVRYADDFVVMCHTLDQAEMVRPQLEQWLAPRGLSFNEDKTRIVHVDDGFDFLGFNVRRYGGKRARVSPPDPRGAVLASRWLRDGRTPGWALQTHPHRVGGRPGRTSPVRVERRGPQRDHHRLGHRRGGPAPTTPVAFLRWLLKRHDLTFSPTLLAHARRDQEHAAAQERREQAAQELVRSAEARATARADLHGPGHRLAQQVLDQATRAAAERKAAAIRAEHAAQATAVARARPQQ